MISSLNIKIYLYHPILNAALPNSKDGGQKYTISFI
jgi:hypothetical protein